MVEGSPPGTPKSADRPTPAPGAARAEPCQIAGKPDQAESASVRLIVILVGLSGSGKTTIATALAERLNWPFEEGDDLYSTEALAKLQFAVGTRVTSRPPHRSVRAQFGHTAPTSGV